MGLEIQVPASYPPGFKMVIVGEAPEKQGDLYGHFAGYTGRVMQKACQVAGFDWSTIALSNISKRFVGGGYHDFEKTFYETVQEPVYTPKGNLSKRTKKIVRSTMEYEEWCSLLRSELEAKKPNLVVVAGNAALKAITSFESIANYRGSILPDTWGLGLKCLAVEHPKYITGDLTDFWILSYDLKKAKREAEFPEIKREPFLSETCPQLGMPDIRDHLAYITDNPHTKWTLDVETRAGTLACFAIACRMPDGEARAFCIPLQTTTGPYWSPEEECQIWEALSEAAQANPNLCNQNIEYDLYYLLRYGIEPSGVYMDTMLAHSILYPEFPKGLDFLCSFYLDDVVYYKGEGRDWGAGDRDPQLWEYCCKDAVYTLRVVEKIDEQLKERELFEFYHGEMSSLP